MSESSVVSAIMRRAKSDAETATNAVKNAASKLSTQDISVDEYNLELFSVALKIAKSGKKNEDRS